MVYTQFILKGGIEMTIENKVVIITGASSGWRSYCKILASKGARVVMGARREDKLKALAEEIQKLVDILLIV